MIELQGLLTMKLLLKHFFKEYLPEKVFTRIYLSENNLNTQHSIS